MMSSFTMIPILALLDWMSSPMIPMHQIRMVRKPCLFHRLANRHHGECELQHLVQALCRSLHLLLYRD